MYKRQALILLGIGVVILCLVPLTWILPVYVIGHRWKFLSAESIRNTHWGLKSVWFVGAGALIASFVSLLNDVEYLNSILSLEDYEGVYDVATEGFSVLIFILLFGLFILLACRKIDWSIVGPKDWSWGESILYAILYFIAYKIVIGVYYSFLIKGLGIPHDEIYSIAHPFMSNREDIDALVITYGTFAGFFLVAVFVPFVEEIAFRGIYLDGIKRYINFPVANFLQALIFATVHWSLMLFPVFLLFGLICGFLRKNSNGLMTGIIFHMINNLAAMSVLIAQLPE